MSVLRRLDMMTLFNQLRSQLSFLDACGICDLLRHGFFFSYKSILFRHKSRKRGQVLPLIASSISTELIKFIKNIRKVKVKLIYRICVKKYTHLRVMITKSKWNYTHSGVIGLFCYTRVKFHARNLRATRVWHACGCWSTHERYCTLKTEYSANFNSICSQYSQIRRNSISRVRNINFKVAELIFLLRLMWLSFYSKTLISFSTQNCGEHSSCLVAVWLNLCAVQLRLQELN